MSDQTCKTCSVPEAAKVLGIGKNQAYAAAKRGEIHIIKMGIHAAMRADELPAQGDMDGTAAWRQIITAIKELQKNTALDVTVL